MNRALIIILGLFLFGVVSNHAADKIKTGTAVDCMPTPNPAIMLVAGPVRDCFVIDKTGDVPVPV